MGQGHTVAAIDSVNLLLRNVTAAHAARYTLSEEGLTRYVRDFYSYELGRDGRQASPLGSHVSPHTAGALAEGGYLGFTELQYSTCRCPASASSPSSATARSRNSAEATGHRAAGAPRTAAWSCRS